MIEGLKPYAAHKDSGVPSLLETPEHWEVKRLAHMGIQVGSAAVRSKSVESVGGLARVCRRA